LPYFGRFIDSFLIYMILYIFRCYLFFQPH
jgi:hypothetical protein